MILERDGQMPPKSIPLPSVSNDERLEFMKSFVGIIHLYRSAMQVASTQLEILDNEFAAIHDYSPIHHMERRVKSLESITEKLKRKGHVVNIDSVQYVQDIAGIRVICNYVDDIYYLRDFIISKNCFHLIREHDYIRKPKPNGYRSLHLIVRVPIVISEGRIELPVEIQLRTIAMDMWASLEHDLRYKSERTFTEAEAERLRQCAEALQQVDIAMQRLFQGKQEVKPNDTPYEADFACPLRNYFI